MNHHNPKCSLFLGLYLILSSFSYAIEVDDIIIIPKVVVDTSGFSGDLAIDPNTGRLHCIWVTSDYKLMHKSRSLDGIWSDTEIIPTLGLPVYAEETSGENRWARRCCGINVDEGSVIHIVYGVDDGDVYYVCGQPNQWTEPYRVVSQDFYACHPDIEIINDDLFVVWEDARDPLIKRVYQASRINNQWSEPSVILLADNPDLYKSDNDILYIIGRYFHIDWPVMHHNIMFGYSVPGYLDWEIKQITDEEYRVGKAARIAIYQDKIYVAWSTSVGVEASGDWDKKGRLYCAKSREPGKFWNPYYSKREGPIYTVATGDPYGAVAIYSDGTVFYANGKAGEMARQSSRFFKIWLGKWWSGTRYAEWENGVVHLDCDGKTVWAIGSSTGYSEGEVSVSGYTNPFAGYLDFSNQAPEIVTFPDTFVVTNSLWQTSCEATDPDGDPVKYSLIFNPSACSIDSSSGLIQWQVSEIETRVLGVKASDNRGKCDVHYFRLHVVDQIYHVHFSVDQQQGTAPFTVQFTNLSQGPIEQVH
ncbi:hypothetical protein EH221_08385, partial [bacterium]